MRSQRFALLWGRRVLNGARLVLDDSGDIFFNPPRLHEWEGYFYTAKYAANGALLWQRWDAEGGIHMALDPAGNLLVSSMTNTAKYASSTGARLWQKQHTGPGVREAVAVAVDRQGNIIATGSFSPTSTSQVELYTAKHAGSDGSLLWEKRHASGAVGSVRAPFKNDKGVRCWQRWVAIEPVYSSRFEDRRSPTPTVVLVDSNGPGRSQRQLASGLPRCRGSAFSSMTNSTDLSLFTTSFASPAVHFSFAEKNNRKVASKLTDSEMAKQRMPKPISPLIPRHWWRRNYTTQTGRGVS